MPYPDRLHNLVELHQALHPDAHFRGIRAPRSLGLLSGLYIQTRWQLETGRDASPLWNRVNSALSILPVEFYRNGCRSLSSFDGWTRPACTAWFEFFKAESTAQKRKKRQRLLWEAHTASVRLALSRLSSEDSRLWGIPAEEIAFWKGWVTIVVLYIYKVNFPTTKFPTQIIGKALLPACYPLGTEGCRLKDLSFGQRKFAKLLISLSQRHTEADLLNSSELNVPSAAEVGRVNDELQALYAAPEWSSTSANSMRH